MVQDGEAHDTETDENWSTAIEPEEQEQIQKLIRENLKTSLKEGPEFKKVNERKRKEKVKVIDKTAQDPKEFLYHEYNGRCQICSTRLQLANGKSYFEVYRIREDKSEAWWNNLHLTFYLSVQIAMRSPSTAAILILQQY